MDINGPRKLSSSVYSVICEVECSKPIWWVIVTAYVYNHICYCTEAAAHLRLLDLFVLFVKVFTYTTKYAGLKLTFGRLTSNGKQPLYKLHGGIVESHDNCASLAWYDWDLMTVKCLCGTCEAPVCLSLCVWIMWITHLSSCVDNVKRLSVCLCVWIMWITRLSLCVEHVKRLSVCLCVRIMWITRLSSCVDNVKRLSVCLCGYSILVCAASEDCCLHVFSTPSGRRLCPAIALPSAASQLLCSAAHVMVVTSQASVFVWSVTCYYMKQ